MRLGTGELYAVLAEVEGVEDSLVVHLEDGAGGAGELLLFVRLAEGVELTDGMQAAIKGALREQLSPRHVPDRILAVPSVPYTLTGKKLEVPVKRILQGEEPSKAASADALADPGALRWYADLAKAALAKAAN